MLALKRANAAASGIMSFAASKSLHLNVGKSEGCVATVKYRMLNIFRVLNNAEN